MNLLQLVINVGVFAATFRLAISVALATLGTTFAGRSGILCMGQEGIMLICGCTGVIFSYYCENPYIALLGAVIVGILLGLLYAYFAVSQYGNNVIIGVGLNFFGLGFSAMLIPLVWGNQGTSPTVTGLDNFMTLVEAREKGTLAQVFGVQNIMLIICLVLVIVGWIFLYKTKTGLRIRIAGELPMAIECTGGSVVKIRYLCMAICGMCLALAGCMVSLGQAKMFGRNMMAGRGYVGLALCTLGRYNPVGALLSAILYGFTDAIQTRLQGEGVPAQFIQMLPYVFTIVVIACSGKINAPAALGVPFKGKREQ